MFLKFFITFSQVSSVHKYSSRDSPFDFLFQGPRARQDVPIAIHHWNALPNEIKNTSDFNMFKQLVKKYLASHNFKGS